MKTLEQLKKEFGPRLVQLHTPNAWGLRGGLTCATKRIAFKDLTADMVAGIPAGATVEDSAGDFPCMDFVSSTNALDRYNEVISQDGWELDNFLGNPVVPDCHDYSSVVKILARDLLPKSMQIQGGALCCRAFFAIDNPLGNIAWKMAKGGFIKSQSVGFIPLEWTNGNDKSAPDRTYTRCELLEKSLVVVPANPGATIGLALKQGVIERRDLRELADYLKQFCSEADPSTKAGTSGAGTHDVQLLNLARALRG